jgi:hypothetical protein
MGAETLASPPQDLKPQTVLGRSSSGEPNAFEKTALCVSANARALSSLLHVGICSFGANTKAHLKQMEIDSSMLFLLLSSITLSTTLHCVACRSPSCIKSIIWIQGLGSIVCLFDVPFFLENDLNDGSEYIVGCIGHALMQ